MFSDIIKSSRAMIFTMIIHLQVAAVLLGLHYLSAQESGIELPDGAPLKLTPFAKIQSPEIREASGLIKSRLWNIVYWTLNDSGNDPRIYAINHAGKILKPDWHKSFDGIEIEDAVNVDWEAITTDQKGYLYIADIGNNANARRDLTIYKIPEPYPFETAKTSVFARIFFYFPEQANFPANPKNFDAEALFMKNDFLYLLTKNRSDNFTQLYQIDPHSTENPQPAKLLEKFQIGNPVTDASYDPDRNQLVILTNKSIWLFENQLESDQFLSGKIFWLPISAGQCEAVCFKEDQLIILNEEGGLFQLSKQQLIPVQK
jgi:hypothetical protein